MDDDPSYFDHEKCGLEPVGNLFGPKVLLKSLQSTVTHASGTNHASVAGAGGFEPPNGGIKIRCLTTWLRPKAPSDCRWLTAAAR
jgi:hypothetical protein